MHRIIIIIGLFFLQILISYLLFVHTLFDKNPYHFDLDSSKSPFDTFLIILIIGCFKSVVSKEFQIFEQG